VVKTDSGSNIAYSVFVRRLKNPFTRKNYEIHFQAFRKALKASEECNDLLKMDGRTLEDAIVSHIQTLADAGASTASINLTVSAIKNFFVANREENRINWKWLKGELPPTNGRVKDRDYSKEELIKMWIESDTRKKAILALLMTGVRKGAIPGLRLGNLTSITEYRSHDKKKHAFENHIYRLTVYENEPEEYITFLSPEGTSAIDSYIEARKSAGETISGQSPLIRDAFDTMNAKMARAVTTAALDMAFTRLTRSLGIRPKEKEGARQDRHEVMLFHGVRKFVNHQYVNAGVEPIKKEALIGHRPPGLEGSYLRPTEDELLTEFVKVIPYITLGQEAELKMEINRLQTESGDIDALKRSYLDVKLELEKERGERERLYELLYRQGLIKKENQV
jgi:site-specific recombinase XerD